MARETLTGSRIRERRMARGIKQAELAERAGISGPYLNLIEHNRRRIGGALLNRIAGALGVEATLLAEGAGATLVTALQEAAAARPGVPAETDRAEEFAGRFPGWAELLSETAQQTGALQRSVEALADRLNHDPQLAASLHEVLSTVTAIRSTAAILADEAEIEPAWRDRFHRNLNEDAARLAQSSQALVAYLEAGGDARPGAGGGATLSPEEEVERFHAAADHHHAALEAEGAGEAEVEALIPGDMAGQARFVLLRDLRAYLSAARALPLARLRALRAEAGDDPLALARAAGVPVTVAMRRLAALPRGDAPDPHGLVIADAAGAFLYRKPLPEFPVPRFGAGCPLWPLTAAFGQPLSVTHARVRLVGRDGGAFDCYAAVEQTGARGLGRVPAMVSVMLISPAAGGAAGAEEMGVTCRICPAVGCLSRRAPPIRRDGG